MSSLFLLVSLIVSADADDRQTVFVVVGAHGADEYQETFTTWAKRWEEAADQADAEFVWVGRDGTGDDDRDELRQRLAKQFDGSSEPLWLVLIGHGTFDGRVAKFNLQGPDVSAGDFAEWLKPCKRPLAIINCASSSSPFINQLSGPNRVIVTATRSGYEQNYARFGDFISSAITDPDADLDKDKQTSLLEAFLLASSKVEAFYKDDARLATEHALLDDNGDKMGTPATFFRGIRATRSAKDGATVDGFRANQVHLIRNAAEKQLPTETRERRDELELRIARLRESKEKLGADEYYQQLEVIVVELARLYEQLDVESDERTKNSAPARP